MSTKMKFDSSDICVRKKVKPFQKLPITSPWQNRAPFFKPSNLHKRLLSRNLFSTTNVRNKSPKMNIVTETTTKKTENQQKTPDPTLPEPSTIPSRKDFLTNSSTQFQYFMRLMQLFPMIHPAYIHSVLTQCNNDFVKTIDTLLRTRQSRIPPQPRKFPTPLQFYPKISPNGSAMPRFMPRMPVIKMNNGFNGMNGVMNPQMYRQFGNYRLPYPTILPKPHGAQFGGQKADEVPVVKIERKDSTT